MEHSLLQIAIDITIIFAFFMCLHKACKRNENKLDE